MNSLDFPLTKSSGPQLALKVAGETCGARKPWITAPKHNMGKRNIRVMTNKASSPRILVVDDDPGIRHLIWSVLKNHGFSVTVAHDPREARLRLQSERFEMLVTDHEMPRETGLSFITQLRNGSLAMGTNTTDIPVVMVSAKSEPDHIDAVKNAGIQALVQKPFLPTAFVQLLNEIVSSKRSGEFICLSMLN